MVVGIDPGKSGAIVSLGETVEAFLFPLIGKEYDRVAFSDLIKKINPTIVSVEDVHAMAGVAASANWSLSQGKEMVLSILSVHKIPFVLVSPKQWQSEMFQGVPVMKKPSKRNDTKAMALVAAKRLFPNMDLTKSERSEKPHEGIVDALLIAEFTRRNYGKRS